MLRYEDPDGDMISLNADDELEEALRLCGDGKTLKMTLTAAQESSAATLIELRELLASSSISSIPPLDEPDALPARPTTPAYEACPMSEETQDAVTNLESMGFTDRAKNLELLQKHKNNVERVVNELFDA